MTQSNDIVPFGQSIETTLVNAMVPPQHTVQTIYFIDYLSADHIISLAFTTRIWIFLLVILDAISFLSITLPDIKPMPEIKGYFNNLKRQSMWKKLTNLEDTLNVFNQNVWNVEQPPHPLTSIQWRKIQRTIVLPIINRAPPTEILTKWAYTTLENWLT